MSTIYDHTKNVYRIKSVLDEVLQERLRQEALRDAGKFLWTCASLDAPNDRKMSVLSEEVGEVAKEIVDYGITEDKYNSEALDGIHISFPPHRHVHFLTNIRKELIQVAAVCVAWVEALDAEIAGLKAELQSETVKGGTGDHSAVPIACTSCAHRRVEENREPYCTAVNKPYGITIERSVPAECGPNRKLWRDANAARADAEVKASCVGDAP